jgi:hypothetical protein
MSLWLTKGNENIPFLSFPDSIGESREKRTGFSGQARE